uniref:Uncharacterized protein n=1 Tax=Arundo donax TaxID=35708 RepID=A0A0A9GTR0_ARUDO
MHTSCSLRRLEVPTS